MDQHKKGGQSMPALYRISGAILGTGGSAITAWAVMGADAGPAIHFAAACAAVLISVALWYAALKH
jgi:hypothetical protein